MMDFTTGCDFAQREAVPPGGPRLPLLHQYV
ncbi:hypothetical protein SAMN05445850_8407 [Paraburkholderia tuberum]|uniref:Uncharacterized protein n=1 Tax=Paraburkholderia tuberum TaxID=157910 RepID=A0A1H1KL60_9BURK|nr:hypothetical protein SAMN05445850_8407 [Paraburkholderia tuberum]